MQVHGVGVGRVDLVRVRDEVPHRGPPPLSLFLSFSLSLSLFLYPSPFSLSLSLNPEA